MENVEILRIKTHKVSPGEDDGLYEFKIRCIDIPSGISKKPNVRIQNINVDPYPTVKSSLENIKSNFYTKCNGINIFAYKVEYDEKSEMATIYMDQEVNGVPMGIANGGHVYEIIQASKRDNKCPDCQYVKVHVHTGIPNKRSALDLVAALNSGKQVEKYSLEDKYGSHDFMKIAMVGRPGADTIMYCQGMKGSIEVRRVIQLMFNLCPAFFDAKIMGNKVIKGKKITWGYNSRGAVYGYFIEHLGEFKKMDIILPEILELYDYVTYKASYLWNKDEENNRKAGLLTSVFDSVEKGKNHLHFIERDIDYKIDFAFLSAIHGAFVYLVRFNDKTGKYEWSIPFHNIKKIYDECGTELWQKTKEHLDTEKSRDSLGKSDSHWQSLTAVVVSYCINNGLKRKLQKKLTK